MNSVKKFAKPPANKADEVIVVAKKSRRKYYSEVLFEFLEQNGIALPDVDKFVMRRYLHEGNDRTNGKRNGLLLAVLLNGNIYIGWCRRMAGDPKPWNQKRAEEIAVGRIVRLMEGKAQNNVPPKIAKYYNKIIADAAHRWRDYFEGHDKKILFHDSIFVNEPAA